MPDPAINSGAVADWLNLDNATKAIANNPAIASQIGAHLATTGDTRAPGQWLLADLLGGDPNSTFSDAVKNVANKPVDVISTPSGVSVPTSVLGPNTPEPAGGFDLAAIISSLGELIGLRPNTTNNTTIAPVTNTTLNESLSVDNSVAYTDARAFDYSSQFVDSRVFNDSHSESYTYGVSENTLNKIFDRLTNMISVPAGGNGVISPANPPVGYAQNMEQSTQRTGFQTIATVTGLPLTGGNGPLGIPWKTVIVGAILSTLAYVAYKRFFGK